MIFLHVINTAHVPVARLAAVERAVQFQENHQLRKFWHVGSIRFSRVGWKVYIVRHTNIPHVGGFHQQTSTGTPFAEVTYGKGWTLTFSHEILEMMVDPHPFPTAISAHYEVCDPVNYLTYVVRGETVSDFVTKAYFTRGAPPYDWLRKVKYPQ